MAAPNPIKADCIKKYLKEHSDTNDKTLARLLIREEPLLFKNLESTRKMIAYYRGHSGDNKRKMLADKSFVKELTYNYSPYDSLPEGLTYYDEWEPCHIQTKKALITADWQFPYYVREAVVIQLEYAQKEGIDTLVLLGDIADFYAISRYEKDPRKRSLKEERDGLLDVLSFLRKHFPEVQIIYKLGNHEERYERVFKVEAPALFGIELFDFSHYINAEEHNINVIGDRKILKIAGLNVIHGHEFGRSISTPVNPARGLYLRGKEHCIAGHYHQTSHHAENTMNDQFVGCWSIGCGCDLHPQYLPINKWNYGFAVVNKYDEKNFEVFNKKIIKGKIYAG